MLLLHVLRAMINIAHKLQYQTTLYMYMYDVKILQIELDVYVHSSYKTFSTSLNECG